MKHRVEFTAADRAKLRAAVARDRARARAKHKRRKSRRKSRRAKPASYVVAFGRVVKA